MAFKRVAIGIELRDGKDGDGDGPGADVALMQANLDGSGSEGDEGLALIQIVHEPGETRRGRKVPWRLVEELMEDRMILSEHQYERFEDALQAAVQVMRDEAYSIWLDMHRTEDGNDDPNMQ